MAADLEKLGTLHDSISDLFLKMLQDPKDLKAADLAVIVKFLKDNDVTALPVPGSKTSEVAKQLAKILPFPTDGDDRESATG